jgi:hypothetical protein
MNKIEHFVYALVYKNPRLKIWIRNVYQSLYDLLPRLKDWSYSPLQCKEGFFCGFHDVDSFSVDEKKLLANHCINDRVMPTNDIALTVGYFDFENGDIGSYHSVGHSYAWNFHKGCRQQWLSNEECIYNTAFNGKLISNIVNVVTDVRGMIDYPIDAVYAKEMIATSFSYERLEHCMPGYGYHYKDGGELDELVPQNTGLFLVDIPKNERELIVSIKQLADDLNEGQYLRGYMHYVTHTEFSKDGRYISFLHRWIDVATTTLKRWSRLMIYDRLTKVYFSLPTQYMVSHYVWNNENQIVAYCTYDNISSHVLFSIVNGECSSIQRIAYPTLNSDGHQSFVNDSAFITDTYPNKRRIAYLYMTDMEQNAVKRIASLYSGKTFQSTSKKGHVACDLHPRVSASGNYVCFDSCHTGKRSLCVMRLKYY